MWPYIEILRNVLKGRGLNTYRLSRLGCVYQLSLLDCVNCLLSLHCFLWHCCSNLCILIAMQSLTQPWNDVVGVYGDVVRVKILFNKKDTALIQFVDATQAQRGTTKCFHVVFYFIIIIKNVLIRVTLHAKVLQGHFTQLTQKHCRSCGTKATD